MLSEREKMAQQMLYDANGDSELIALRDAAADLCFEFNHTRPSDSKARKSILAKLLGTLDDTTEIVGPIYINYGFNVHVGHNFFANYNLTILDEAEVRFGDHVFIGPNCGFYTAGHPEDSELRNAGIEYARPITVGDSVWFGAHVVVLPGVTIGSNIIVGAGSVVTKDIPDNVVACGNPCRVLRPIDEN